MFFSFSLGQLIGCHFLDCLVDLVVVHLINGTETTVLSLLSQILKQVLVLDFLIFDFIDVLFENKMLWEDKISSSNIFVSFFQSELQSPELFNGSLESVENFFITRVFVLEERRKILDLKSQHSLLGRFKQSVSSAIIFRHIFLNNLNHLFDFVLFDQLFHLKRWLGNFDISDL